VSYVQCLQLVPASLSGVVIGGGLDDLVDLAQLPKYSEAAWLECPATGSCRQSIPLVVAAVGVAVLFFLTLILFPIRTLSEQSPAVSCWHRRPSCFRLSGTESNDHAGAEPYPDQPAGRKDRSSSYCFIRLCSRLRLALADLDSH